MSLQMNMGRQLCIALLGNFLFLLIASAFADLPSVGAAPKGDATIVASRIIKITSRAART